MRNGGAAAAGLPGMFSRDGLDPPGEGIERSLAEGVPGVERQMNRDSSVTRNMILVGIRGYKKWISPLLPASCRFEPTCSVYAMGCYQRFGLAKATYLTLRRLSRCHPFHPGGHDPVPEADPED